MEAFIWSRGVPVVASTIGFALLLALGRMRVVSGGRLLVHLLGVGALTLLLAAPGFSLIIKALGPSSAETNALGALFGLVFAAVLYVPSLGFGFLVVWLGKSLRGRYAWVATTVYFVSLTGLMFTIDRASLELASSASPPAPGPEMPRPRPAPPARAPEPEPVGLAERQLDAGPSLMADPSPGLGPTLPETVESAVADRVLDEPVLERVIGGSAQVTGFHVVDPVAASPGQADPCVPSDRARVAVSVAEHGEAVQYPVADCAAFVRQLRARCTPSVVRSSPFAVEVGLDWVRHGRTMRIDGLEEACARVRDGMRAGTWCRDDFTLTRYRLLSMGGPLVSVSKMLSGGGGGGPPFSEERWQTIDLRTGKPAVLTEWVDEASLVAGARDVISPTLGPDEQTALAAAKTWKQVCEIARLDHPVAFALGVFDAPRDQVTIELPFPDQLPGITLAKPLELRAKPATALRPFLDHLVSFDEPQPLRCAGVAPK